MARLVLFRGTGPVQVGDPPTTICGCGLSKSWPYCTGAHINTASEEENKIYLYDEKGRERWQVTHITTEKGTLPGNQAYSPI